MSTIGNRIGLLVKHFSNGNNSDFARITGTSETNVRNYIAGTQPKFEFLSNIAKSFELNYSWLLTGEGGMLAAEEDKKPCVDLATTNVGIPYYDVDFCGGFDHVFNDQSITPAGLINLPIYDKAELWANITGRSMEPLINHGDIIAIKQVHDWNTYLLYGEIYGIITDEYRTVKRIRKSKNPNNIILEPLNKDGFDDQEISKNIIRGVWAVIGYARKLF